jgi:hypothetical protein
MGEWASVVWVFVPVAAIVGGIMVVIVATVSKGRIRELEIKERIALIEKGMVPPPEVDPHGFDNAMGRLDRIQYLQQRDSGGRHRRAGITLLGVGLGLMVLLGFTAGSDEGLGIGGFICILGLAFLINSFFESRTVSPPAPPAGPSSPIQH